VKLPLRITLGLLVGLCPSVVPADAIIVTKAMTATLAAVMVEAGELTWEQTLAEAFPELAEEMDVDWRAVTLGELLSHRSGARRDPRWKLHVNVDVESEI